MIHPTKVLCAITAVFFFTLMPIAPASAQTVRAAINNIPPTGGTPPAGLCHELLIAIGERYGWQVEFTPIGGVNNLVAAVVNSTADVSCAGIGPTNDRRRMGLAFAGPVFTNSEALYVRADDTTPYTSVSQLVGKRVAGQEGATFLRAIEAAGLPVVTFPNNDVGLQALSRGEIDAYVAGVQFRYQTDIVRTLPNVRFVETYIPIIPQSAVLLVRNTDTELLGQLQAGIDVMKGDGTLDAMLAKWGLPPPPF